MRSESLVVHLSSVYEPYRSQGPEGDVPSGATHQRGDVDHWQSPSQDISMHTPEGSAAGAAALAGTSKQVSWHAAMAW